METSTEPRDKVAEWLLAGATELQPVLARHHDDLVELVCQAIAHGRAAWPSLNVEGPDLVGALARAIAGSQSPLDALGELHVEDLYLARACVTGSAEALAAFAESCGAVLTSSLRAAGVADSAIADLEQAVRERLFAPQDGRPRIATYSGRAALRAWVRAIATRAAIDLWRKREAQLVEDDVLSALPDPGDSPELAYFRTAYQAEFKQAFEEALASLEVRDRNLLRQHFVDQLSTEQLGALYGVHKTTAFRWLEAARTALSKRTKHHFQRRVRVAPSELRSILRLVQLDIDLSLSRVLG